MIRPQAASALATRLASLIFEQPIDVMRIEAEERRDAGLVRYAEQRAVEVDDVPLVVSRGYSHPPAREMVVFQRQHAAMGRARPFWFPQTGVRIRIVVESWRVSLAVLPDLDAADDPVAVVVVWRKSPI